MMVTKRPFLIGTSLLLIVVLLIVLWRLLAPLSQASTKRTIEALILEANSIVITPNHMNPTTRSMFDSNVGPIPRMIDGSINGSGSTARNLLVRGLVPQSGFNSFRWRNPFVRDEFAYFTLEIRCEDKDGSVTAVFMLDMSLTSCRMTTKDGTGYGTVAGLLEIPEWTDWVWSRVEAK